MSIVTAENVTLIPAKKNYKELVSGGKSIKVAAYCRVSTEEENQQNSYASQIRYYTEYINSNPEWILVGIFADEGISGTRTKNRTQFNKMIRLARHKKIDLILCKSISRFARNTVDCLDYVRELKSLGVTVIFEKENINTDSMSSEFAISLYASFAQAESESISKNITWGIEKAFRQGKVRYQFRQSLGYRLDDSGKPYVVEEEAEIVRLIFQMYAAGYSSSAIAKTLTERSAVRRNGSSLWNRSHVYQILKNEKYAGDALLQKTFTVNCITHDRAVNRGEKAMYLVSDCHEPIVDRATFEAVRLELAKRKIDARRDEYDRGRYHTKYCLSQLLICPYCGGYYKRTTWILKGQKVGVWRCKNRMEGIRCKQSPSYYEDKLQDNIIKAVNGMFGSADETKEAAAKKTDEASDVIEELDKGIRGIISELSEVEKERESILASISGNLFEKMGNELKALNQKESVLAEELLLLKRKREEQRRNILSIQATNSFFEMLQPLTEFDNIVLRKIIHHIEAVSKDEIVVTFNGGYKVRHPIE